MPLNLGFPERDYPRCCAMCGWMPDQQYPWEENLNPPTHCPRDGMPLERLSCQACGAPVHVSTSYNPYFGRDTQLGSMCVHCGEPVTLKEPKRRERPPEQKKRDEVPDRIEIPDVMRLTFDDLFAKYGRGKGKYGKPEYVTLKTPEWAKKACARGKAAIGCTCAGCKAIRRRYRRQEIKWGGR